MQENFEIAMGLVAISSELGSRSGFTRNGNYGS